MNQLPSISAPTISTAGGKITATSLQIAEHFGKRHADVIRAIESLELPEGYRELHFVGGVREVTTGDRGTRDYLLYHVTRDGFSLLAMGFTGAEAMVWKISYLNAFNAMEAKVERLVKELARAVQALGSSGSDRAIGVASSAVEALNDAFKVSDDVKHSARNAVLLAHAENRTASKRPAAKGHNYRSCKNLAGLYGESGDASEIAEFFRGKGYTAKDGPHWVLTEKGAATGKAVCGPGGDGYEAVYWDHDFAATLITK